MNKEEDIIYNTQNFVCLKMTNKSNGNFVTKKVVIKDKQLLLETKAQIDNLKQNEKTSPFLKQENSESHNKYLIMIKDIICENNYISFSLNTADYLPLLDFVSLMRRNYDENNRFLTYKNGLIMNLISSLDFLHNKIGLAHGELNSDNVVITNRFDFSVKIIHPSFSTLLKNNKLKQLPDENKKIEELIYIAPELFLNNKNDNVDFLKKCDIYSLGMLIGLIINENQNVTFTNEELIDLKLRNELDLNTCYSLNKNQLVPKFLEDLMNDLICFNAEKRPKISTILDKIQNDVNYKFINLQFDPSLELIKSLSSPQTDNNDLVNEDLCSIVRFNDDIYFPKISSNEIAKSIKQYSTAELKLNNLNQKEFLIYFRLMKDSKLNKKNLEKLGIKGKIFNDKESFVTRFILGDYYCFSLEGTKKSFSRAIQYYDLASHYLSQYLKSMNISSVIVEDPGNGEYKINPDLDLNEYIMYDSSYRLGNLYYYDLQNTEKGLENFIKSSTKFGNVKSILELGRICLIDLNQYEFALNYFKIVFNSSSSLFNKGLGEYYYIASYGLAICYMYGLGTKIDFKKAKYHLKISYEKGKLKEACNLIGLLSILQLSSDVEESKLKKVNDWFKQACSISKNPNTFYNMAICLLTGLGLKSKDRNLAFNYLLKSVSVDENNTSYQALNLISKFYQKGIGSRIDLDKALLFAEKALKFKEYSGHAHNHIASIYYQKYNFCLTADSLSLILVSLNKSIKTNYPLASYNMGLLEISLKNYDSSIVHFKKYSSFYENLNNNIKSASYLTVLLKSLNLTSGTSDISNNMVQLQNLNGFGESEYLMAQFYKNTNNEEYLKIMNHLAINKKNLIAHLKLGLYHMDKLTNDKLLIRIAYNHFKRVQRLSNYFDMSLYYCNLLKSYQSSKSNKNTSPIDQEENLKDRSLHTTWNFKNQENEQSSFLSMNSNKIPDKKNLDFDFDKTNSYIANSSILEDDILAPVLSPSKNNNPGWLEARKLLQ